MEKFKPHFFTPANSRHFVCMLLLGLLVVLCGCSPSPNDLVGDWARPMGLANWDGHLTGEDFVIHFSADGTYRVFDDGSAFRDQGTTLFYFWEGSHPPKWTGKWHLDGNKICITPEGHSGQSPITIEHFTSKRFEASFLQSNLRTGTFYHVPLTEMRGAFAL